MTLSVKKKLVLDVDTGVDDAMAILTALKAPEAEVLAIGTVWGNVPVPLATENTLRVLEVAGVDDVPVAAGAARPLLAPFVTAEFVHGEDGLGNTFMPKPRGKATGEHAADQLIRLAREYPGEITLVPVGPLTNIALALTKEPQLPELIKEVVLMGGVVCAPGNMGPMVEANIGHDPEAAKMVLAAGWPITMVGLDVTTKACMTEEHRRALAESTSNVARFVHRITPFYLDAYEKFIGERKCAMHDPMAVLVALDPSLVKTAELYVDVETRGELTRGMTVADLRGLINPEIMLKKANVKVCLEIDERRFMERFITLLMS